MESRLHKPLTARQERFCLLIVKGEVQTKAYVKAGYAARTSDIAKAAASRLATNVNVQARIADLRESAAKKAGISLESITDELMVHNALAKQLGQVSAATGALALAARLHGLLVDQKHVDIVHHKPAREAVMKDLELSEDEWLRLYKPQE